MGVCPTQPIDVGMLHGGGRGQASGIANSPRLFNYDLETLSGEGKMGRHLDRFLEEQTYQEPFEIMVSPEDVKFDTRTHVKYLQAKKRNCSNYVSKMYLF